MNYDESKIERRPGSAHGRGYNPLTRLVSSGLELLRAGTLCKFCDREATMLIARGTTASCHEHAARYEARRREQAGL